MKKYIKTELDEAYKSISSTLGKSEKALLKIKINTAQYTMLVEAIRAYKIALKLITEELTGTKILEKKFENSELENAIESITFSKNKVEKILPKFAEGTSQHTLAIRRIRAFTMAIDLIEK